MDADIHPTESSPLAGGIARSAAILSLGSITSRVLGLVRDTVKSHYFGATGPASMYGLAIIVPQTIYDLSIGGMVNSALVPVFSEYVAQGRQAELARLSGALLIVVMVFMAAAAGTVVVAAPLIADFLAPGYAAALRLLLVRLLRVLAFSLFFMSLSAVLTGLLYAFKRFTLPALAAALFNLGIVICGLTLHRQLGVTSLAVGFLVGAILQVVVQLPDLRGISVRLLLSPDWHAAGLRQIGRLYLPIVLGLVINNFSVIISNRLIAATGEQSLAWNSYATTLMQFPLGLVVTAVSLAILPRLACQALTSVTEFKATLAQGLKLVLALIVPATAGMIILARPISALLYEHGSFQAFDSQAVSFVLGVQMLGVLFAAFDQLLIIAFYARKDTLTPALVGVACVLMYLGIAGVIACWRPLNIIDLVAANNAQLAAHALIMLALFRRRLGGLDGAGVWTTLGRAGLAALGMAGAVGGVLWLVDLVALPAGLWRNLLRVGLPGAVGVGVYFWLAACLKISEVRLAAALIRRRIGV